MNWYRKLDAFLSRHITFLAVLLAYLVTILILLLLFWIGRVGK